MNTIEEQIKNLEKKIAKLQAHLDYLKKVQEIEKEDQQSFYQVPRQTNTRIPGGDVRTSLSGPLE